MRVAARALRRQRPAWLVVAAPVAAPEACDDLAGEADDTVCAMTPEPFYAVGLWYRDFSQTTDEEVQELLTAAVHGYQEA
jgi:predicted phosphoribosyltransferase